METVKLGRIRLYLQREKRTKKEIDRFYLAAIGGNAIRVDGDSRTWNPLISTSEIENMQLGEIIQFTGQTTLTRIV
jgi:hypothetical protein